MKKRGKVTDIPKEEMVLGILTKKDKRALKNAIGAFEEAVGLEKISCFLYNYVLYLIVEKEKRFKMNMTDEDMSLLFTNIKEYYFNCGMFDEVYKKSNWNQKDWEG